MSVTRITPDEASARLQADSAIIYLDVRSVAEFKQGHPPGAINIPLADHHPTMGRMAPNPRFLEVVQAALPAGTSIICGCAAGGRSLRAAQMMVGAGYADVVDMNGGFSGRRMPPVQAGWVQLGLPVSTDGEPYESVLARIGG